VVEGLFESGFNACGGARGDGLRDSAGARAGDCDGGGDGFAGLLDTVGVSWV